jgi:hypothetical protein
LGSLNPPPQLLEFEHPNGKDGPDLTDRQGDDRANSFSKLTHTQKHANNPN